MILKWYKRWMARCAFTALYKYYDIMSDRSVVAGDKVIEVLDIIRDDMK